ncbi:hypothetical protein ASF47_20075, partial [Nocardioides sp. Leaf285]
MVGGGGGGEVPGVGWGLVGRGLGGWRGLHRRWFFSVHAGCVEGGEGLGTLEVLGAQVEVDHPLLRRRGLHRVQRGQSLGAVGDHPDRPGFTDLQRLDHGSSGALVAAELGGGGADQVVEQVVE